MERNAMSPFSAMPLSSRLHAVLLAAALLAAPVTFSQDANAAPAAASPAGTGVKPWPAPVGHHQPQASDVPPEARQGAALSEERLDAEFDRKLMICRGC